MESLKKHHNTFKYTLCISMIVTGLCYFIFYDHLIEYFTSYGYPLYLIIPLAILKIMASLLLLFSANGLLRLLSYTGFFYNFILAFFAHMMIYEFDPFPSIFIILLILTYYTDPKRINKI